MDWTELNWNDFVTIISTQKSGQNKNWSALFVSISSISMVISNNINWFLICINAKHVVKNKAAERNFFRIHTDSIEWLFNLYEN